MPDYYRILGVERTASQEEIKRAFRALARKWHPDRNPDAEAEERFKEAGEAYEVLCDPVKRERYDTFGDARAQPGLGGFGDLGDIIESFFGGTPFGRARARPRGAGVDGGDVAARLDVTFREAVFGCSKGVEVSALRACGRCRGGGCDPGTFRSRCTRCGGSGEVRTVRQSVFGTVMASRPCPDCGGVGERPAVPCRDCRGEGRTPQATTLTVDIPPGVQEGMTLRLRGRGEAGVRGGADGDLYVQLAVAPDPVFERDGDDVVCSLEVPLTQAILGAELTVDTLDGEETIRIAPGTRPGTVVRIKGHGAPRLHGRGRGDLVVHVVVDIPRALKAKERALVEELAAVRGEPVGRGGKGMLSRLRDSLRGPGSR
ncbi:MAG: molecular chaperone DnaJ [Acidobacteria bacterium]|nr:molecular chaperone DnaJ [Acidobacteriota bacterium]